MAKEGHGRHPKIVTRQAGIDLYPGSPAVPAPDDPFPIDPGIDHIRVQWAYGDRFDPPYGCSIPWVDLHPGVTAIGGLEDPMLHGPGIEGLGLRGVASQTPHPEVAPKTIDLRPPALAAIGALVKPHVGRDIDGFRARRRDFDIINAATAPVGGGKMPCRLSRQRPPHKKHDGQQRDEKPLKI